MDEIFSDGLKILQSTINQTIVAETALITITIAIYEKFVKQPTTLLRILIRCSWLFFIVSILGGLGASHQISAKFLLGSTQSKIDSLEAEVIASQKSSVENDLDVHTMPSPTAASTDTVEDALQAKRREYSKIKSELADIVFAAYIQYWTFGLGILTLLVFCWLAINRNKESTSDTAGSSEDLVISLLRTSYKDIAEVSDAGHNGINSLILCYRDDNDVSLISINNKTVLDPSLSFWVVYNSCGNLGWCAFGNEPESGEEDNAKKILLLAHMKNSDTQFNYQKLSRDLNDAYRQLPMQ